MSAISSIQDHIIQETKKEAKGHTGTWTTTQIRKLGISSMQRDILAYIAGFERSKKVFFASNKHMAEFFEISESSISRYITQLKRMNLIEEAGFNGRHRRLACLYENWTREQVANSLKDKDSKKVLCAKFPKQDTKNFPVSLRKSSDSIYIVKKENKGESKESSSKPSSYPKTPTPKKEAMDPIEEKPLIDDASGGDDLIKPSFSSSQGATDSSDIVVTKSNGQELRVSLSEVYQFFLHHGKEFTTEEIEAEIKKFRELKGEINNVKRYLLSMCQTTKKQRLSMTRKNTKTTTPKPDYTNLYPEPVPHKKLVRVGDLMKMTKEELDKLKKEYGI